METSKDAGVKAPGENVMEGYLTAGKKMDALAEAVKLIYDEFERTRDMGVAAAGHVLSGLIVRHMQALERELDTVLDKAGL